MSRILVIGPDFHGYNEIIGKCFNKFGHETAICNIRDFSVKGIIREKLCRVNKKLRRSEFLKICNENGGKIKKVFHDFNPEYVLLIKGNAVSVDLVREMKKTSHLSLWMMDSFVNAPTSLPIAQELGFSYIFEVSDIERYKSYGIEMRPLMLGYDEFSYYPKKQQKDVDISFVGINTRSRLRILERLIVDFPTLKMEFYGDYFKSILNYREIFKYYVLGYKRGFMNRRIDHPSANDLYNRSKICLNIHNAQSSQGWNARTNEILGAGAFQLVDDIPAIRREYGEAMAFYTNYDDLKEKIRHYLANPQEMDSIAKCGYALARNKHKYSDSVEIILNDWI